MKTMKSMKSMTRQNYLRMVLASHIPTILHLLPPMLVGLLYVHAGNVHSMLYRKIYRT